MSILLQHISIQTTLSPLRCSCTAQMEGSNTPKRKSDALSSSDQAIVPVSDAKRQQRDSSRALVSAPTSTDIMVAPAVRDLRNDLAFIT